MQKAVEGLGLVHPQLEMGSSASSPSVGMTAIRPSTRGRVESGKITPGCSADVEDHAAGRSVLRRRRLEVA